MKHIKKWEDFKNKTNENVLVNKYHKVFRNNKPKLSQYLIISNYFGLDKSNIEKSVNDMFGKEVTYNELNDFISTLEYWNISDLELINGKSAFWKGYFLKAKNDMILAKLKNSMTDDMIPFDEVMTSHILGIEKNPKKLHSFIREFLKTTKTTI